MEISLQTGLILAAFGLLVSVTGGVLYLTAIEWRDRRRRDRDKRYQQRPGNQAKPGKAKPSKK